ncbi:hypothetical protein JTB14_014226 [Gonioctena quinquepunctata]|nr:hypothetical protein JTB14_014226 [Gonioctena quinquepunctata]
MKCLKINFRASDRWIVSGESAIEIITEGCFPCSNYEEFEDIFCEIFDDDVSEHLLQETKKYAYSKNHPGLNITKQDLEVFFAILILSGYNAVPSKRNYWDSQGDLRNEFVYTSMRRNRFLTLSRFSHCADNSSPSTDDKMWKLRPLMVMLPNRFLQLYRPEQHISFDESMIEYFGRHGSKQCIRNEFFRYGYKAWCLSIPDGYFINFYINQGKNPNGVNEYEEKFGKCAAPMIQILDMFPYGMKQLSMYIYFNNLFTSMGLLQELRNRNYHGTGAIRENRIPASCKIKNKNQI